MIRNNVLWMRHPPMAIGDHVTDQLAYVVSSRKEPSQRSVSHIHAMSPRVSSPSSHLIIGEFWHKAIEQHESDEVLITNPRITGLCPYRIRELCRRRRGRWQARRTSFMGYGGARRLRSSPTSFISRFPRHPYLLRRRFSGFSR